MGLLAGRCILSLPMFVYAEVRSILMVSSPPQAYGEVNGMKQAEFHCENDPITSPGSGHYKAWSKDAGAIVVILFLSAVFFLIAYTTFRNRAERARAAAGRNPRSGTGGGLSIRADPLHTAGDPKSVENN